MGRGRQKAKATRQARDMKYFSPATDLSALERELAGNSSHSSRDDDQYSDHEDRYADYTDGAEEDGDSRYGS